MIDTYASDIARAADSVRAPNPSELQRLQREMWARHRFEAWRIAPIGTLTGEHVARGAAATARARKVERVL